MLDIIVLDLYMYHKPTTLYFFKTHCELTQTTQPTIRKPNTKTKHQHTKAPTIQNNEALWMMALKKLWCMAHSKALTHAIHSG